MDEEKLEFKEWFKEFRLNQGFSQPKMAKALGVCPSTISNLEAGKTNPSPLILLKISTRFNLKIEDLRKIKLSKVEEK